MSGSEFLRSTSTSTVTLITDANESRVGARRTEYDRIGPDGTYEAAPPFFMYRVLRKLQMRRLGSHNTCKFNSKNPNCSVLGRIRVAYERWVLKAGSTTGELTMIPIANNPRAPPSLTAAVSTWIVSESRKGTKISDLDPGFKLTASEKKYLEHLMRSASMRS